METSPSSQKICATFSEALIIVLGAMERLQRHFHPLLMPRFHEQLLGYKEDLERAAADFKARNIAPEYSKECSSLTEAANRLGQALELLFRPAGTEETVQNFMKAMRQCCRAQESLFTICRSFPSIDRFFLEEMHRATPPRSLPSSLGASQELKHVGVERKPYGRKSFSLYIPERYDASKSWPVVVALHGGFGHGRDFIWMWLREARTRGFFLAAPTSRDRTWSFFNPAIDYAHIAGVLRYIADRWRVDPNRILLTGMSDGAIFTLITGLQKESLFSALAPVAAVLHPLDLTYARNRRILWLHGAADWMFNVEYARQGYKVLNRAGADIELRIINDLAHAYPRERNNEILTWFDPSLALD